MVGSWLVRRLVENGADVVCLVRDWVPQSEMVQSQLIEQVKVVRGDVRGALVQNEKMLAPYYRALDDLCLPVQRGYPRSRDDEIRRDAILSLMCNFTVSRANLEAKYGIVFADYFRETLAKLAPFEKDGMCRLDEQGLHAVGLGQIFVRNLAMCFDAYLPAMSKEKPIFSRTV